MYAVSPLRYPGAKWRLEGFIGAILEDNNLSGSHYAEPYAGGASLALSLLYSGQVSEIHLNDLDRSVWAFWKCSLEHTNELIARIRSTKVTIEEWYLQKEIQAEKQSASILDLGFSTFFLNRTNRSGILSAGVIGGKGQTGKWKIDARFNKSDLIERVLRLKKFSSQIHLTRLDASTFIRRRSASLPQKASLLYLDPPYFRKGEELYLNSYRPVDHANVASLVTTGVAIPWIVSYDDVPEIRSLYRSVRRFRYVLRYSASSTRRGKEVVFLKQGLKARAPLLAGA